MLENIKFKVLSAIEKAAFASYKQIGYGNRKKADDAAVQILRFELNKLDCHFKICIGEGERDKAPMLFIDEELGNTSSDLKIDVAVDPLEGTNLCAEYRDGAISTIVIAQEGSIIKAPDIYMEKIALNCKTDKISIHNNIETNLEELAIIKNCLVKDLTITVLKRNRHLHLIEEIRKIGSKIKLIDDGDINAILELFFLPEETDMYIGIGGAPEGVIASSFVNSLGGMLQGRFVFSNDHQKERALNMGIKDLSKIYNNSDFITKDSYFIATGITNSRILNGIKQYNNKIHYNSLIINYKNTLKLDTISKV